MSYQEFQPHPALQPYIDAYWVMKSDRPSETTERIYPDGCIDIILNLGDDFLTDNGTVKMKHEAAYLVGTMTQYMNVTVAHDTYLLGIRFKPLGFPTFYQFSSLHEITNKTIEFNRRLSPPIYVYDHNTIATLDNFYCKKISDSSHVLTGPLDSIKRNKGIVGIDQLARQHFMSDRKFERQFRRYLGISPKEYARFVRYQYATQLIRTSPPQESLLGLAIETGFYDHAHLTNEIKKYSGLVPSQIRDVGFSPDG
ncbi:MAG TPA: helix-turn-helix transcriptional regulator [Flavitalea sp.]|nr:helix-turn-helix transcriptional regulator [Flavitalea sp.]